MGLAMPLVLPPRSAAQLWCVWSSCVLDNCPYTLYDEPLCIFALEQDTLTNSSRSGCVITGAGKARP